VGVGQQLQHSETRGGSPRGRGATMVVALVTIGGLDPSTASLSRRLYFKKNAPRRFDM